MWKIADPATRMRAPAATTVGAVFEVDAAVDLDGAADVARAVEQRADLA